MGRKKVEQYKRITGKCYIFAKSVITMDSPTRIQTAFRFTPEELVRIMTQ